MNAPLLQYFSYDPFDPAVMADPLPYYRVLRDEHPVYYIDKWDTYALSRFSDIWQVLEEEVTRARAEEAEVSMPSRVGSTLEQTAAKEDSALDGLRGSQSPRPVPTMWRQ